MQFSILYTQYLSKEQRFHCVAYVRGSTRMDSRLSAFFFSTSILKHVFWCLQGQSMISGRSLRMRRRSSLSHLSFSPAKRSSLRYLRTSRKRAIKQTDPTKANGPFTVKEAYMKQYCLNLHSSLYFLSRQKPSSSNGALTTVIANMRAVG